MKIKLNIFRLIDLLNIFDKFPNADKELGYAIAKTKLNILDVLAEYHDEITGIQAKYEVTNEEGEKSVPSDKYQEYILETADYLNKEVEVEIHQVPRKVFKDTNYYNPECKFAEYELLVTLFSERPTTENKGEEASEVMPIGEEGEATNE